MTKAKKKASKLITIRAEKDTWVLQLPDDLCASEGFAQGTLASLTIKDGAILGTFIHPSQETARSVKRFSERYAEFMKEIADVDA